jgi:hypothetical protein
MAAKFGPRHRAPSVVLSMGEGTSLQAGLVAGSAAATPWAVAVALAGILTLDRSTLPRGAC